MGRPTTYIIRRVNNCYKLYQLGYRLEIYIARASLDKYFDLERIVQKRKGSQPIEVEYIVDKKWKWLYSLIT